MTSVTVVGAGVFGASTARELAKRGLDVTLVEQYTPGTVRSGSGGDTRLSRAAHGSVDWYTRLSQRARTLWLELQEETGARIWEPVGVAWFAQSDDGFEARSRVALEAAGVPCEWLSPEEARDLYPSLGIEDLSAVLYEPDSGVLHARRATQLLVDDGVDHGVRFETSHVSPAGELPADAVVWACGAWLPRLFPDHVELRISRRDVYFFGADGSWNGTPGFCDYDEPFYGHGEIGGLGVKVAPDVPGDEIDPDRLDRLALPALEQAARDYTAKRFPSLADAPIVGSRVCQYELTGDTHFLFARHPERPSWWLLGGGSGHGFKHGPALAEYVADCIEGRREPESFHALGPRTGNAGLRTAAVG